MSTPIPPNIKLEGLELYAPRGARAPSAPGSQASPSQTLPHVPECDQLRADEGEQPSAAAAELPSAGDTPIDDAIGTAPSLPDREHSFSAHSLPPAPKLRLERDPVSGPPSAFKPPRLDHHLAEAAPRRRLRLDPEIVPPPPAGARLSAGAGTKGPRLHDWCYLELADLEGEEFNHHSQVLWTRGLLIRRNIANGDLAYFTTWCPAGTSIKTLVRVEGHRWAIEDSFETAKNEFGLDHNESRSWHGWHRHVSLVMLAFAMMAAIQHQANKPTPKKTKSSATPRHPISSLGRSRKSAA